MTVGQIALLTSGFVGRAFFPDSPLPRAVIVVTGSDGGLEHAAYTAERFAERGITALALSYFRHPGLRQTLTLIPLEYIERAAAWLKHRTGLDHIAAYGVSKGAEYPPPPRCRTD